jgi:formylglycine-generating enzyme required for sulfatase activity
VVLQTGQEMTVDLGSVSAITLLWVSPTSDGGFAMGSPASENDRSDKETQHTVILTKGFWLGRTEVTQAQWVAVMGANPSEDKGDNLPVTNVSWYAAMAFCKELTAREQAAGRLFDGYVYTLPSEAQWEYACRAGTTGAYAGDLNAMAWHILNSKDLNPVGTKQANAWGFYDMHGNAWEWCRDWFDDDLGRRVTDPTGPSTGDYRVNRGGGCGSDPKRGRSAARSGQSPGSDGSSQGFRLSLGFVK